MRYNPYCDVLSGEEDEEEEGEEEGEEMIIRHRLSFGDYLFQTCDVS